MKFNRGIEDRDGERVQLLARQANVFELGWADNLRHGV